MTWEWSHTTEAYEYTREQLGKLKHPELLEIAEAWKDKLDCDIQLNDLPMTRL